jgi:hypothetical protein
MLIFFTFICIDDNTYNEAVKFLTKWFMGTTCDCEIVIVSTAEEIKLVKTIPNVIFFNFTFLCNIS